MEKAPTGRGTDRLKIDMPWQDAAARLIATPAKSAPPRAVKARKKPTPRKPKP